jgi:hypothetical protein
LYTIYTKPKKDKKNQKQKQKKNKKQKQKKNNKKKTPKKTKENKKGERGAYNRYQDILAATPALRLYLPSKDSPTRRPNKNKYQKKLGSQLQLLLQVPAPRRIS